MCSTCKTLNTLNGYLGIGHVRYSTSGQSKTQQNTQPIVARYQHGQIALAHNGSLTNAVELRAPFDGTGFFVPHHH